MFFRVLHIKPLGTPVARSEQLIPPQMGGVGAARQRGLGTACVAASAHPNTLPSFKLQLASEPAPGQADRPYDESAGNGWRLPPLPAAGRGAGGRLGERPSALAPAAPLTGKHDASISSTQCFNLSIYHIGC